MPSSTSTVSKKRIHSNNISESIMMIFQKHCQHQHQQERRYQNVDETIYHRHHAEIVHHEIVQCHYPIYLKHRSIEQVEFNDGNIVLFTYLMMMNNLQQLNQHHYLL